MDLPLQVRVDHFGAPRFSHDEKFPITSHRSSRTLVLWGLIQANREDTKLSATAFGKYLVLLSFFRVLCTKRCSFLLSQRANK